MAKAPAGVDVASWDGNGQWFKVHEISAVTNGGQSISWPSSGKQRSNGNYLSISRVFPTQVLVVSSSPCPNPFPLVNTSSELRTLLFTLLLAPVAVSVSSPALRQ
jgi:hypothetical protein